MTSTLTALLAGRGRDVCVDDVTLSSADLLQAANAAAAVLVGLRRVAVHAEPSMTTVVAVVAGLLAGVEVVPVPADAGNAEVHHLVGDSRPDAWLGPLPTHTCELPHRPVDLAARSDHTPPPADASDPALVLYTSGTTGPPKGVLLTHGAIAHDLDALADAWSWTAGDVLAHGLPLFHVHGLILGVLGPLRVGSGLIHTGRPTPERYGAAARAGATMFFGVPTVWSRVADSPDEAAALRTARLLVSGSAALPAPVFNRLRDLTGHEVVERYGMSESLITVATRADGRREAGWVGVAVNGVETRLRDDDDGPVPHDGASVGHLEVRGPTLFSGYLGRPEATAATWTDDGWFRTGDAACIAPDGRHRIVGRTSVDLIKSGGYRVGAGEIESCLLGHPAVAECAVAGVEDTDLGQRIVAWVVPRSPVPVGEEAALAEQLTSYVTEELSAHKRPREIRFTSSLPRNEMGKVQKSRLA